MMRFFKRRGSTPDPQLESVSSLSGNMHYVDSKKADWSTDALNNSNYSPRSESWYKAYDYVTATEQAPQSTTSNDSSNESMTSSESNEKPKLNDEDVKRVYEMYKNCKNGATMRNENLRNVIKSHRQKCVSENIELNQSQFTDYLTLMEANPKDIDKIFSKKNGEDNRGSPELGLKKKSRRTRLRSMFTKGSSSKSDDEETDISSKTLNKKSSSIDSISSLLSYLMPKRMQKTSDIGNKVKSDESGYGSDANHASAMESPMGSIKSAFSQTTYRVHTDAEMPKMEKKYPRQVSSDDTDSSEDDREMETTYTFSKFYGRSPTKSSTKKRPRSKSRDLVDKNSACRFKFTEDKKFDVDTSQCCLGLNDLSIDGHNSQFKYSKTEYRNIQPNRISPNSDSSKRSAYFFSEIAPNSTTRRNQQVQVRNKRANTNKVDSKERPYELAKDHLTPINNDLKSIISRASEKIRINAKRSNSFKNMFRTPSIMSPAPGTSKFSLNKTSLTPPSCKTNKKHNVSVNNVTKQAINQKAVSHKCDILKHVQQPEPNLNRICSSYVRTSNNKNMKTPTNEKGGRQCLSTLEDHNVQQNTLALLSQTLNSSSNRKSSDRTIRHNDEISQSKPFSLKTTSPKSVNLREMDNSSTAPAKYLQPSGMRKFAFLSASNSDLPKSMTHNINCNKFVTFSKGPGRKSLGFTIVGGKDSSKGPMGIYVKRILENGQAADSKLLQEGDELLSINGSSFQGLCHLEAINLFKSIKNGEVVIKVAKRHKSRPNYQSV